MGPTREMDISYEEFVNSQLQVWYARRMFERQVFMNDLKQYRLRIQKRKLKKITQMVGPVWYQVLSVNQRKALDNLEASMYQDNIACRPIRVFKDIRDLGIIPAPHRIDLMNCIYIGKNDPKEMLALLFNDMYNYPVTSYRSSYPLTAKIILSGIFYLGLQDIISSLHQVFRIERKPEQRHSSVVWRSKRSKLSPYLDRMVATLNTRPKPKRDPPLPMPPLDIFNNQYVDEVPYPGFDVLQPIKQNATPVQAQQTPALAAQPPVSMMLKQLNLPPLPQIKTRKSRAYCDKIAGIYSNDIDQSNTKVKSEMLKNKRKSQFNVEELRKQYGVNVDKKKKIHDVHDLPPLMSNAKYAIKGVAVIHDRYVYILECVALVTPSAELIHGGITIVNGHSVINNLGYRAQPPPAQSPPCKCVDKWQDAMFEYIKNNKCTCGHNYDFYNEGEFPQDELPFFYKPTSHSPYRFDYNAIFETDKHTLLVSKEFKRIWETDSMLCSSNTTKDMESKRKKIGGIVDSDPKPEEYLKTALTTITQSNAAATLPNVHLTPELIEWMKRRMYGPISKQERAHLRYRSNVYWQMFATLGNQGYGHINMTNEREFSGHTDWLKKISLAKRFVKFRDEYKYRWFKSQAKVTNLLWPTMFQDVLPDKQFRQIYFSYLQARLEDVQLLHPYCPRESHDRKLLLSKKNS